MAGSGKRIDYSLRPAKNVERKMMCEVFRRLRHLARLGAYEYIGLGSFYFVDFVLFHKQLGIPRMWSIESDPEDQARCRENRPYDCIKVIEGHTNTRLSKLVRRGPAIAWLDYDGVLNGSVLKDVETVCSQAQSGSVLAVTVRAHTPDPDDVSETQLGRQLGKLLKQLRGALGRRVPEEIQPKDLNEWGLACVCRRIIHNQVQKVIAQRNGGRPAAERVSYRQLFNFHYQDSARMLTVGGVLYAQGTEGELDRCAFEELPFVKSDSAPYHISVPRLTYVERRRIDAGLPAPDGSLPNVPGVPPEVVRAYAHIYRYFPTFAEAEI